MKILLFFFIITISLYANIATVFAYKGKAIIIRDGKTLTVKTGIKLQQKDILITKDNSKVQLVFSDNTMIGIGKDAEFSIYEYLYNEQNPKQMQKATFGFVKGIFKTITGKIGKINPSKFKIKAKSAHIGIRGTKFKVSVSKSHIKIDVSKGGVYFKQNNKITNINSGESMVYNVKTGKIKLTKDTLNKNSTISTIQKNSTLTNQNNKKTLIKNSTLTSNVKTKNISVSKDSSTNIGNININP